MVNINEINAGAGARQTFDLVVEGFYDANFSDVPPATVPEPSTLALLWAGLAGLRFARRRRR